MKKIIYTNTDGAVHIVIPTAKENIEQMLGPLTQQEYEDHIYERSIPAGSTKVRVIDDSDIPTTREFRNAWVDITKESRVDVCCTRAKNLALDKLRINRNNKLKETDSVFMQALETNDTKKLDDIKKIRKDLRDLTEPLKAIVTTDKVNDEVILQQLRDLSMAAD